MKLMFFRRVRIEKNILFWKSWDVFHPFNMENIQPKHQAAEVLKLNGTQTSFSEGKHNGRDKNIPPKGNILPGSVATSTHKNIHESNNQEQLISLPKAHRNKGDDNKHHPAEKYYQQRNTTSRQTTTTTSGCAQPGSTTTSNTGSKTWWRAISQNKWGQTTCCGH